MGPMKPFDITIEITEATQCHQIVSQLLRIYPSLRLAITIQDETNSTPARASQNDHYYDLAGVSPHCPCGVCAAARQAGRLDSDSSAEGTGTEAGINGPASASRAASEHAADEALRQANAVHRENIAECSAAEKERDRGNNHPDAEGPGSSCK